MQLLLHYYNLGCLKELKNISKDYVQDIKDLEGEIIKIPTQCFDYSLNFGVQMLNSPTKPK